MPQPSNSQPSRLNFTRTISPVIACLMLLIGFSQSDAWQRTLPTSNQSTTKKFDQPDKFRQLEEILPTPNTFRTGSGAPGSGYWQQQVDYDIDVRIDDEEQELYGKEIITYKNNSQDSLKYLWLQLDANIHHPDSDANLARTARPIDGGMGMGQLKNMLVGEMFDGSIKINEVKDVSTNKELKHTIVKTMMRVDLPQRLAPGKSFKFSIDWNYAINNARVLRGRSGYEFFPEDGNYIYEMAQWFPRLCAYTDVTGWQHKQFLGRGEFTLEMGDYVVRITMPEDHVVASTGTLLNADQVLSKKQLKRWEQAKSTKEPIFIVTPEEAKSNETSRKKKGTKTWIFKADEVRDFAFASSRKFIWDAMQHNMGDFPVMAMSFYPNEGEPLWSKYSTHAIIHTLNVYSRYTFDYPYPVAISVNGPIGGMEYPMICFNGPRPESDGTYTARTKYGLISVIIHEVGHNYFPMIVNTDERQWTWMDEGLNTFLQFLAEQEWEENYPSRRGEPADIVGYMRSTNQVPIMTNSESILQFGPNGYSKPATALNILRETVLGRELFDYSFKEYAMRWKFKRPMPADFFRTMEDASGVDLDWFWRGWFFSTDHVDMAITDVRQLTVASPNPEIEKGMLRKERDAQPMTKSKELNKSLEKRADVYPNLKDFYNKYDPLDVTEIEKAGFQRFYDSLSKEDKELIEAKRFFYQIDFENIGGLVMPVIFEMTFEDDSKKMIRLPAEIWNKDNENVTKMVITKKPIKSVTLDPRLELADVEMENNHFPPRISKSRFQLFRDGRRGGGGGMNPMREAELEKRFLRMRAEQEKAAKEEQDEEKDRRAKAKEAREKREKAKKAKEAERKKKEMKAVEDKTKMESDDDSEKVESKSKKSKSKKARDKKKKKADDNDQEDNS